LELDDGLGEASKFELSPIPSSWMFGDPGFLRFWRCSERDLISIYRRIISIEQYEMMNNIEVTKPPSTEIIVTYGGLLNRGMNIFRNEKRFRTHKQWNQELGCCLKLFRSDI
jgi:hypothetical protein